MTDQRICATCGGSLNTRGLCPPCLLRLGIAQPSEEEQATPSPRDPNEDLGAIGPYRLLSVLGEGGMGIVYLAEQREPIRRRVALKVIRRGMDSREVIARFESERQALALMSHPSIARVLDAGKTEAGLPFFVMEYVPGIPITDYCDRHRLVAPDRLKLFVSVCQAVQHAHQKGVIHRDIKPSNVLVSLEDETPEPKVIDFGVAKAVNQRLTEKTLFTEQGILVGTPGYMSPEQAEMSTLDTDTRTDIYSLGVLLYELMAGALPFDPQRLRRAGYAEMQRIIREEEPPKPSTRVRTLGDEATRVAERRQTDPSALQRQLSGELDWITLKALEKDRTRRYQSANEFAADIQRHLSNEPVAASPPSATYRFQKLVRRHRILFAAAAAVFFALLTGAIVSTVQYLRAEKARKESRGQVVRLHVTNGMRLVDEGDFFAALPWLVRALKLEEGGEKAREVHRYRIASVLDQCPRLARLWTHEDEIWSAAFSPDGSLVATASRDKTARVWSLETGEPVSPPLKHEDEVSHVEFDSTGGRVVTTSSDRTARVWDARTGRALVSPLRHDGRVSQASFSADGRLVVSASEDGTARVWDAGTGRPVAAIRHEATVYRASFSPDGEKVLTVSEDGTALLSETATGKLAVPPMRHRRGVQFGTFSADGRRIATTSGDATARVWDVESGEPVTPPLMHDNPVDWAAFSPDGRVLVTAAEDNTARVWNPTTGEAVGSPLRHSDIPTVVVFSPDGRYIATAAQDGKFQLWDTTVWRPAGPPLRHSSFASSVSFHPSGRYLLTSSVDGTARVWDLAGSEPRYPLLRHETQVQRVRFDPEGRRLATGIGVADRPPGYARVWDPFSGEPLTPPLRHGNRLGWGACISFDGKGDRLATASLDKTARVWDARTGEPLTNPLQHESRVHSVSFSPDGRRLLTAGGEDFLGRDKPGEARLWDIASGRIVFAPLSHRGSLIHASFSPDGRRLATAGGDGVRLWDAATGRPAGPLLENRDGVQTLSFDGTSSKLVTAGHDGVAAVWDAGSSQPAAPPLRHGTAVTDASFSQDGRQVVTATITGVARLWDASSGRPLGQPLEHGGFVYTARFSRDDRFVVTAGLNGRARIWEAATGQPVSAPFQHGTTVWEAIFAPDGRSVATASSGSFSARAWDFLADEHALEDLESLGDLLAARRLDATTGDFTVSGSELKETWARLSRRVPDLFSVSREKVIAWHRRNGESLTRRRRWVEALVHLDEMIELIPGSASARLLRGGVRAELGQLPQALEESVEAFRLRPDDPEIGYGVALLQLSLGDEAGYRGTLSGLLTQFGKTRNPDRAAWLARTAMLAAPASPDAASLAVNLAETALEIQADDPNVLELFGGALLRAGRLSEAADAVEKAVRLRQGSSARASLLLSLARGRVARPVPAKPDSAQELPPPWRERLELQVLQQNAGRRTPELHAREKSSRPL